MRVITIIEGMFASMPSFLIEGKAFVHLLMHLEDFDSVPTIPKTSKPIVALLVSVSFYD
jgi:hypothetical protein